MSFVYSKNTKDRDFNVDFSKEMWALVVERQFQSSIYYFYNEEDAKLAYEKEKEYEHHEDGHYDGYIFLAKVNDGKQIKTVY